MTDTPPTPAGDGSWPPWAWRCSTHRKFGRIMSQDEYHDLMLLEFPKHWRQGCVLSLWPLGQRHRTRYLAQASADAPVLQSTNRAAFA